MSTAKALLGSIAGRFLFRTSTVTATIQALQRELRARGLRHRGPTKAYWAEGKRGLD